MESQEIKKCPYCAESIKREAIKCRHCGSDLVLKEEKQAITKSEIPKQGKEGLFLQTMNCGCVIIFAIIFIIILMVITN